MGFLCLMVYGLYLYWRLVLSKQFAKLNRLYKKRKARREAKEAEKTEKAVKEAAEASEPRLRGPTASSSRGKGKDVRKRTRKPS